MSLGLLLLIRTPRAIQKTCFYIMYKTDKADGNLRQIEVTNWSVIPAAARGATSSYMVLEENTDNQIRYVPDANYAATGANVPSFIGSRMGCDRRRSDHYGRDDSTGCFNSGGHGKCVGGGRDAQAYDYPRTRPSLSCWD